MNVNDLAMSSNVATLEENLRMLSLVDIATTHATPHTQPPSNIDNENLDKLQKHSLGIGAK